MKEALSSVALQEIIPAVLPSAVGELCLKAKSTNESDKSKSMFLNPRPVVMRPSVPILCGSSEYA